MADNRIFTVIRCEDRDYAHFATDEAAQYGVIRPVKYAGLSQAAVTHFYSSSNADPAFLFTATAVLTAMYPLAVIATDAFGNITAREAATNKLIGGLGPKDQPVNGTFTQVQSPIEFLTRMGIEDVAADLSGEGDGAAAIAAADLAYPFVMDPKTVLSAQVRSELLARLIAALTAVLPDGGQNQMSSSLGFGGAIAQAYLNKYGAP